MKTLLLIFGAAAIAVGLFLWDSRKRGGKIETGKSTKSEGKPDHPRSKSNEWRNNPEVKRLKQSAAAELGIPVEQLDRMSVEEIIQMATDRGLI
jgi:FtsZ-interacting cell division protein ZipA